MAYTIYEIPELPKHASILTLEEEVEKAPVLKKRPMWQKVAASVLATLLYVIPAVNVGCNGNGNGPNGDPVNPIGQIDSSQVTPQNGTTVGPDDNPLEVGLVTPNVNPEYEGTAPAGVDVKATAKGDNATPSDGSDDWEQEVFDHTGVPLGTYDSGNLDTESVNSGQGAKDGEKITLDLVVTALDDQGESYTRNVSVDVVYEEGSENPVRVLRCDANGSAVGASLSIKCYGESDNGEITGWELLTGGPEGAIMFDNGNIGTPDSMEASDVGLHTYTVNCTDGTDTSDPYTFTVPVDEHISYLILHCAEGSDENLRLPETSVDTVAEQCGEGFNPSLKPDYAGPEYILDVDHTCVQGAIDSLTFEEQEAHENYNNGDTVDDVYSTCSVDFAQVRYSHY